jgi:uncharacterized membrane protein
MEKIVGRAQQNVGSVERLGSATLGAWMVWRGLRRGVLPGAPTAAAGIALIARAVSGYCPMYGRLGIDRRDRDERGVDLPLRVEQSVVVMRPAHELYGIWRDLAGLPRFMRHLESVTVLDDARSRWVARGPAGTRVSWDAVIVHDEPGAGLGWRSVGGEPATEDAATELPPPEAEAAAGAPSSRDTAPRPRAPQVDHAGSVRFRALRGGAGTAVTVVLRYRPAGGVLGAAAARLLGENPDQQIAEDLARFRELAENRALTPA